MDYAGAGSQGRLTIADAVRLGRNWMAQPKVDGCYVHVHTDRAGKIERVLSRSGAVLSRKIVGGLLGAFVSWPDSVLCGELEAHTEAGNRAARARGWRAVHVFDAVRVGGRYLAREPYRARRDALLRAQSEVVNLAEERSWTRVEGLRGRDKETGRYVLAAEEGWRLCPVVDQVPVARAGGLWDGVQAGQGEGLVLVNINAPMGRRNSKRKLKPVSTLEAVCIKADGAGALLHWIAGDKLFVVGAKGLEEGRVFEVLHDGFYDSGEPRFARVVRERMDLQPASVH